VDTPVACTLADSDARAQLDEWRDLLCSAVTAFERPSSTELSFRIGDTARLPAVVELARRELACCPFLEFSISIDVGGATLLLTSPEEATPTLDAFASLVD
jgi:MerR family transcriptional regulator, copper efflux regulator